MKNFAVLYSVFALFLFSACTNNSIELQEGTWRATLKTTSGVEIPFNFELSDSAGHKRLDIINGRERFNVNDIEVLDDSVIIRMPLFDSEIRTVYNGKSLKGKWTRHLTSSDVSMDFNAEPNTSWRFFKAVDQQKSNVSGKWSTVFTSTDNQDTTIAIGEFQQEGSTVTGTFLTTTGDYRFLEGTISGNNLYLSCFDGSHAYLFTGKVGGNNNTITGGKFYSGLTAIENWAATKDDKAMLPDAYSLTYLKPGYSSIDFSFPDLEGNTVSLKDEKFKNKVVIIQFMGSWCPNCMDETAYLVPFYTAYKAKGVEIVGLAYERFRDERAKKNVLQLKNRFNIPYDLLLTGHLNDKKEVAESLPALNSFLAFPTTIIVDKKGAVRKIHTGFAGPGTGEHYTEFITEFEGLVNDLLAEK